MTMDLSKYLLDTFQYNSDTNIKSLEKIRQLRQKEEAIKYFSDLINSQCKWMARMQQDPRAITMSWWDPVYPLDELEEEWRKSVSPWIEYINLHSEEELSAELSFVGYDGARWAASAKDIALQSNYHSIHHRAQIQTIIRQQGLEPDFVDYIGTRYRRIG